VVRIHSPRPLLFNRLQPTSTFLGVSLEAASFKMAFNSISYSSGPMFRAREQLANPVSRIIDKHVSSPWPRGARRRPQEWGRGTHECVRHEAERPQLVARVKPALQSRRVAPVSGGAREILKGPPTLM
jgi:hypothetical protein